MLNTQHSELPKVQDTMGAAVKIDEVLEFLDILRDSGKINMFGAPPYVAKTFKVSNPDARTLTSYWMKTFEDRQG